MVIQVMAASEITVMVMRNVGMMAIDGKVLEMRMPGKRKLGRPKMRYLDLVTQEVGARDDEVFENNKLLW